MTQRKNPITSVEAYKSLRHSEVQEMYRKIAGALSVIQEGTSEEIATHLKVEPDRVWKRLDEMRKAGTIYRPGTKRPLKSGRNGFTWKLTTPNTTPEKKTERVMGGKTVADFSRGILKQEKLF